MQLETLIKLVRSNKNCFGFVKAETLLKEINENLKTYELIITLRRISEAEINIDNIIQQIILPICRAKQVQTKVNNTDVHVFTRKITKLHILNQVFNCINKDLGIREGFEILTNYDLIREDIRNKEIN